MAFETPSRSALEPLRNEPNRSRSLFRQHSWACIYLKMEGLRQLLAGTNAIACGLERQAHIWLRALRTTIERDGALTSGCSTADGQRTIIRRVHPSKRTPMHAKRHRFADPWSLRRAYVGRIEPAADFSGRPIDGSTFRQGGHLRYVSDAPDPFCLRPASPAEPSRLFDLQRRVAAEMAKYRMSGLCSPKELRTIEALWREGISLREHARREGVAPQAIESRIARLKARANRFWIWWRLKHRRRARR
jgi:hypothetical protein